MIYTEQSLIAQEELDRLSSQGRAICDRQLKNILEPTYNGQIVAIHLDSSDYEVATASPKTRQNLRKRHPTGMIIVTDIGPAKMDSLMYRLIANEFLAKPSK